MVGNSFYYKLSTIFIFNINTLQGDYHSTAMQKGKVLKNRYYAILTL